MYIIRSYSNNKVIACLVEKEDGNKFGAYINETIDKMFTGHSYENGWENGSAITDDIAFSFSFHSNTTNSNDNNNNNSSILHRYEFPDSSRAFLLNGSYDNWLFGVGHRTIMAKFAIYRFSHKQDSYHHKELFPYTSQQRKPMVDFIPKRFLVIQMI